MDLGFRLTMRQRVRVRGIDTPELHAADAAKRAAANDALSAARLLLPDGSSVAMWTHKPDAADKYGRWLADLMLEDGRDYAKTMVLMGHAVYYDGGKRGE